MICAACGQENRQGAKFCRECGAVLSAACPGCGTAVDPGDKFCDECGSPIAATPSIASSPEMVPVSGERKQITVLFADVAGSMDLQERLDAEVWAAIMGRFVSILVEGVRKFGGTVDKFTGDGIMALFGAPAAQEDHARRACHAAWQLTKAIGDYSEELRRDQGVELHVRLGLNSGEVVVGRVGDDATLDPTALGHTVGLAQRMEAMAEPGKTYLTERTARLVHGWFQLQDLGVRPVKGSRDDLRVYVLEEPASSPPVLHGAGLGIAPLVGRDRESGVLEDALALASEGQPQVVGVVGEAGVGKSRLCDEFARSAAARGITVRRTGGVSHATEVPLLPVLSLVREYFEIDDADSPEKTREKVAEAVIPLYPELEEALPLLFDFLEVPDPEIPAPQLAPEVRMRRIFDVLRRFTQRRSEREVLLLIVEDLHWFDPQSEAFLERLIESFPGSRTLVVANFRPEFSAGWMRHSFYRQLPLPPLPDQAVSQLLGGLLGPDPSLAVLPGFVLERTGGNPFFVEEVVRSLVEDGTLAGEPGTYRLTRPLSEVKVPPSVQAVLAARIDRLPPEQKAMLQTSAVIGRDFGHAVLAQVTGCATEQLEKILHALCATELLQEAARHPVAEYRFWHPLTQEVAYGTLLAERRAHLHAAVAAAIVELDPNRLDERAALIATHFELAGELLEAARWNDRAATWARRTDLTEAVRRLRATALHLAGVPEGDETLRLAIRAKAGLIHLASRNVVSMAEADRLYAEARTLAERLGDPHVLGHVTTVYGSLQFGRGDVQQGLTSFLEARAVSEPHGGGLPAVVLIALPFAYRYIGPLEKALSLAEEGTELCHGDPHVGMEEAGYSLLGYEQLTRCEVLALAGCLREAGDGVRHVMDLARTYSPGELVIFALSLFPRLSSYAGDEDDCLAQAREAVRLADELGSARARIRALQALAVAKLLSDRCDEAAEALVRALDEARQGNVVRMEEASLLSFLARAYLGLGNDQAARMAADDAVAVARKQGARVLECPALLTRAHVRRASRRDLDVAVADLDGALALVKETGARTYEPFIHEELGRLREDHSELREALRLYRDIGAAGHALRLEAELTVGARPVPTQRQTEAHE